MYYPEPIAKLIDSFTRLPGIGPKTAGRLAFHVLRMKEDEVIEFAKLWSMSNAIFITVPSAAISPTLILAGYARTRQGTVPSFVSCKSRRIWWRLRGRRSFTGIIMSCMEPFHPWKALDPKKSILPNC